VVDVAAAAWHSSPTAAAAAAVAVAAVAVAVVVVASTGGVAIMEIGCSGHHVGGRGAALRLRHIVL